MIIFLELLSFGFSSSKVRLLASVVIGALIRVLLPVLFAARSASSWILERRHLGLDALVAAISLSSLAGTKPAHFDVYSNYKTGSLGSKKIYHCGKLIGQI